MNTEELKRLAEAVLKAYSGLSWQVTMVRNEHGVTHYHIRCHSEPGIAVIKDQYWEDDHIPSVDHYGYIQPDDRMDCDVFRVDIARLIAAANPAAILALIAEIESLRDQVNGLTGSLDQAENTLKESRANDMAAMSWLADCRIASGDHGKRMLPEFVEYLRIMKQQRDELIRIASDAATSLETIHIRSFGDDSHLNHPDQMRAYAGSRAGVVRKELNDAGIES